MDRILDLLNDWVMTCRGSAFGNAYRGNAPVPIQFGVTGHGAPSMKPSLTISEVTLVRTTDLSAHRVIHYETFQSGQPRKMHQARVGDGNTTENETLQRRQPRKMCQASSVTSVVLSQSRSNAVNPLRCAKRASVIWSPTRVLQPPPVRFGSLDRRVSPPASPPS